MQLGEIIAYFQDEAMAGETLVSLGDLALTAAALLRSRLNATYPRVNWPCGWVGRFVNGSSDEEWLTLIGQMSRAGDPAGIPCSRVLSAAASS